MRRHDAIYGNRVAVGKGLSTVEQLQYPIGRYEPPVPINLPQVAHWIEEIRTLPARLEAAGIGLQDQDLDTPYRPGGWTIRQVVHHLADSHMNSYIRFKLALTEDNPTIKPYFEDRWAELPDSGGPIVHSLSLLHALHRKWVRLMWSLSEEQLARTFHHPDANKDYRLDYAIGLYAWHGNHHLAHILSLRERMGW